MTPQRLMTLIRRGCVTIIALAMLVALTADAGAADHMDAPALRNPAVTGPQDNNDLYVFRSSSRPDTTVMILTVNPDAGVVSPTTFDPNTTYEFRIDTDEDALANMIYQCNFRSNPRRPQDQRVIVRRLNRNSPAGARGIGIVQGVGRAGRPFRVGRGGRGIVGVYEDPFFFDLNGFDNKLMFTGNDSFAEQNVSAIVLELPNSAVMQGGPKISVWTRTLVNGNQIDRVGRPAINTVLIPSGPPKDAFNEGIPINDPTAFGPAVVNTLVSPPFNRTMIDAQGLANFLLPDVLTFNVNDTSGFPNGRRLPDDVIDIELDLLTGGALTSDGVDRNDAAFPGEFPYLAPAN